MDSEFIWKWLGVLLVGAVSQHLFYAWKAQQMRKALANAVLAAVRKTLASPQQPELLSEMTKQLKD